MEWRRVPALVKSDTVKSDTVKSDTVKSETVTSDMMMAGTGSPVVAADVTPTVDVVICAYTEERWDDLAAAIRSVRHQTVAPQRLIVVVDHAPGLRARLAAMTDIEVIANTGPRGLSPARNAGVAAASADVVAFLDDDAAAAPDWIERLLEGYANPFALGVGGASLPVWDTGRPAWFPEEYDWVVGCTYRGLPTRTAAVRNMIGSSMSFRRQVLLAHGGFRTSSGRVGGGRLPMGNEETELCVRAGASDPDTMFVFVPEAKVWHRVRAERARVGYFTKRCIAEGLSKASTVRHADAPGTLRTEREYVTRTLRRGVLAGVATALRRRELAGFQRAAVIVLGLVATCAGYVTGRARLALRPGPAC
jgi:GT2 family glycosyltransferase